MREPARATSSRDVETSRDSRPGQDAVAARPPAYGIAMLDAEGPVEAAPPAVRAAARSAIHAPGRPLPYLERIQRSFGGHDLGGVQAHVGPVAAAASRALGAEGFAVGGHVAFAGPPSLFTAAHEAAHVIQQRGGVQLRSATGEAGDPYERHADAVARRVVLGGSAEALLDAAPRGAAGGTAAPVQLLRSADEEMKEQTRLAGLHLAGVSADPGDVLLTGLRAGRPAIINDAAAVGSPSESSNCALDTMGAILNVTASAVSTQWQQWTWNSADIHNKATPAVDVDNKVQSEQLWFRGLADRNGAYAPHLGAVPGGADLLGNAQFYGLQQLLLNKAKAENDTHPAYTRVVCAHGRPEEGHMFDMTALRATMALYPNGTQFAVFLFAPRYGAVGSQHWIYAEKFHGQVVFEEYQKNKPKPGSGARTPQTQYLAANSTPYHPTQNIRDVFEWGSFLASVPLFPPVVVGNLPDPAVDPAAVTAALKKVVTDSVAVKKTYDDARAVPSVKPTTWSREATVDATTPDPKKPVLPAPSVIEGAVGEVAVDLGATATCALVHLTDPDRIRVIGNPRSSGEGVAFTNINQHTKVHHPSHDHPTHDVHELPVSAQGHASTDSHQSAVRSVHTIHAQQMGGYIAVRPGASFTAILHEAFHAYQQAQMPLAVYEGLTEIFASMAAKKIIARYRTGVAAKDDALAAQYAYVYEPSYMPYVVFCEDVLIPKYGLAALAKVYFENTSFTDLLRSKMVFPQVPNGHGGQANMGHSEKGQIVTELLRKLTADDLAGAEAFLQNTTPLGGPAGTATYDARKLSFAAELDAVAGKDNFKPGANASLGLGAVPLKATNLRGWRTQVALRAKEMDTVVTLKKVLPILYVQATEAKGTYVFEVKRLIASYEEAVCKYTGQTPAALRKEIAPTLTDRAVQTGGYALRAVGTTANVAGQVGELASALVSVTGTGAASLGNSIHGLSQGMAPGKAATAVRWLGNSVWALGKGAEALGAIGTGVSKLAQMGGSGLDSVGKKLT